VILSINGIDPTSKTTAELESFFSSSEPRTVQLKLDRLGRTKIVDFVFAQAAEMLKQNDRRIVNGHLVPTELTDEDVKCFAGKR
jgi:hypothetical protein